MPCANHPEVEDGLAYCSGCGQRLCRDCVVELSGYLLCADCKVERIRDIVSGVDPTTQDLATTGRRLLALIIDGLVTNIPLQIISTGLARAVAAGFGPEMGPLVMIPLQLFMIVFVYGAKMTYEGLMLQFGGQTVGKMAMGIKVVTPQGGKTSAGQAWLRAFLRQILYIIWFVNYLTVFFTRDRLCIHDMVARTRVVNWRG